MQLAFDEFKDRFHNSPDQLSQDQRCNKKRSRLNGYFAAVEAQELYEEGRRGIETLEIYGDGCITGRGRRTRPGLKE